MSDTVATFWIITEQGQVFSLGDANPSREFGFRLTEKNYNSWAYITLMARNVDFQNNRVTLNGHTVGNLDPTPGGAWSQQTLIVEVSECVKLNETLLSRV